MLSSPRNEEPSLHERGSTPKGRIVSFSPILVASTRKVLPLFTLLKKKTTFEWKLKCKEAFKEFKEYLSNPLILSKLEIGQPLFFISVSRQRIFPWVGAPISEVREDSFCFNSECLMPLPIFLSLLNSCQDWLANLADTLEARPC